ncbi:DUF6492 family protein [Polynucleobacter necessarius]|uniref:DUF6492 family protein n=1 Tax=Polynucleobacter necessarius TaxID=576610 RepID=UPI000E094C6E|nr:DUF6492 family protein [Polynucleobacter necessarius]
MNSKTSHESPLLIDEVISVCSAKDIDVWTVAAPKIIKNIKASYYTVIVPDSQVALFSSVTNAPYQVKPESQFIGNAKEKIAYTLTENNQDRVGWYLQQFVKIAAVLRHRDDDLVLIWDADTVPVRPLSFVEPDGRLLYYKGSEYRSFYFIFIEKALGLKRTQDFSFIAQSLMVRASWAHSLFQSLENKTQLPWIDAILSQLDPSEPSGFAEFETLGSWIWHHHRNEILVSDRPWYRYGFSLVGNPLNLSVLVWRGLAKYYDFVSFEAWDQRYGIRQWLKTEFRKIKLSIAGLGR